MERNKMKKILPLIILTAFSATLRAGQKDSTVHFIIPDTLQAAQVLTEIKVLALSEKKWFRAELQTDVARIMMFRNGKNSGFGFYCQTGLDQLSFGLHTSLELKENNIRFEYNWQPGDSYRLLIAQATDSASGLTIISGYVFLPRENKWKYIGSGKIMNWHPSLLQPAMKYKWSAKQKPDLTPASAWVQRVNGSWKKVETGQPESKPAAAPVINWFGHYDSLRQGQLDRLAIRTAIKAGKTGAIQDTSGMYYQVLAPGTGRSINVTDTVTVYYKGWIFNTDHVFDQTRGKPAVFPLNRLIRGWQIGLPLLKTGGKIQLIIPSDLAYSVRTRSAKIPPNSILVFEVEVLDSKPVPDK